MVIKTLNEVIQNIKKTMELSKELRSLDETVETYKEYKLVLDGIKEAKEMLNDKDLGDFAKEELSNLETKNRNKTKINKRKYIRKMINNDKLHIKVSGYYQLETVIEYLKNNVGYDYEQHYPDFRNTNSNIVVYTENILYIINLLFV